MFLAHKIQLLPTEENLEYFWKAAGTKRFAWNWGLAEWGKLYERRKAGEEVGWISGRRLRGDLVALKKTDFPWLGEVSKHVVSNAFEDLDAAFRHFFGHKGRYPRFKQKGKAKDSFTIDRSSDSAIVINGKFVRLPIVGWLKLREVVRFQGVIKQVTVSRTADRWFASFLIEVEKNPYTPCRSPEASVGVDLGIKDLAMTSDGEVFRNPKALSTNLRRFRKLSRNLSRKSRDGKNRQRAKAKLARLHARITNIRRDVLHKLTTYLTENYGHIVIEDLNVTGMMRNRRLSKAISDAGFRLFRSMLEYKTELRGCDLYIVDRFYPSSKTCSSCGHIHRGLTLSDRIFMCPACGYTLNRDLNAAINLEGLLHAA